MQCAAGVNSPSRASEPLLTPWVVRIRASLVQQIATATLPTAKAFDKLPSGRKQANHEGGPHSRVIMFMTHQAKIMPNTCLKGRSGRRSRRSWRYGWRSENRSLCGRPVAFKDNGPSPSRYGRRNGRRESAGPCCLECHSVGERGAIDLPGITARCLQIGARWPAPPAATGQTLLDVLGLRRELQLGKQRRGASAEHDRVLATELA